MKPHLILERVGRLISLLALGVGLSVGFGGVLNAQDGMQEQGKSEKQSTSSDKIKGPPCGGPQGLKCPGGMVCADNPSDDCDPTQEGVQCTGICVAGAPIGEVKQRCGGPSAVKCPGGMSCVDDPSDNCNPTQGGLDCWGICATGTAVGEVKTPCGGPSAIRCPGGMICVDDPSDDCNPTRDGIDCLGFCAVPGLTPPPLVGPRSVR